MLRELVYYAVSWLNNFPPKEGVSKLLSPRAIITGVSVDHSKHCKLEFDEYVQTHEEDSPTNSMMPRAIGAIALGSTYSQQASYKFLNLNTGKLITRRSFTPLPLTKDAKLTVEQMARAEIDQ